MNRTQIINIEDAGPATMAWSPEGSDRRPHRRTVLGRDAVCGRHKRSVTKEYPQ